MTVVLAACGSGGDEEASTEANAQAGGLMVQDGDLVEVHYVGTLEDGTEFDSSRQPGRTPLEFTVASGQVIKGFDDAVRGLRVGETRVHTMSPEDAYGLPSDDNIFEVPYGPSQDDVAVGDQVTLTNGVAAVVIEVNEETVVLDANHELAGKSLTFEVEVISITRPEVTE
jgi:FKBP-type peptidyl-prolyl cis-trans isomerase 2